jgi:hypothetical protein
MHQPSVSGIYIRGQGMKCHPVCFDDFTVQDRRGHQRVMPLVTQSDRDRQRWE